MLEKDLKDLNTDLKFLGENQKIYFCATVFQDAFIPFSIRNCVEKRGFEDFKKGFLKIDYKKNTVIFLYEMQYLQQEVKNFILLAQSWKFFLKILAKRDLQAV